MMAGKLTELLEVQDAVKVDGKFTSGAVKYMKRDHPIRAELRKQRGSVRESGGELFSAYDAEFNIRFHHKMAEGARVRHLTEGGLLYRVDNILLNRARAMKTLQCSKVNE
jgi:head-tail adaptor